MHKASSGSVFLGVELLAVATGFAGCLMMAYAFVYIITYGHAIFVEPNVMLAGLELLVFAAGGAANIAVVARLERAQSRRLRDVP